MTQLPGPCVRDAGLAAELRKLRTETGRPAADIAHALYRSGSWMSRVEHGTTPLSLPELERLLDLYQPDPDRRDALLSYARDIIKVTPPTGGRPAGLIQVWAPLLIPPILQASEYARAVLASRQSLTRTAPSVISRAITAIEASQNQLYGPHPPQVDAVLGEAALHHRPGGTAVLAAQLDHLTEVAGLPHVSIRVLPLDTGCGPAGLPPFTRLAYPDLAGFTVPPVVQLDRLHGNGPWQLGDADDTYLYEVAFAVLQNTASDPADILKACRAALG